jgi:hypothetical protein
VDEESDICSISTVTRVWPKLPETCEDSNRSRATRADTQRIVVSMTASGMMATRITRDLGEPTTKEGQWEILSARWHSSDKEEP